MVRRMSSLLIILLAVLTTTVSLAAGPAAAGPPPAPPSLVVTGAGLAQPVTLRVDTDPMLFAAVLDQVSWLRGPGQASAPKASDLGKKYTVVVKAGNAAKQTYDLYPLAKGGPRAYRPAKQPDRRRTTAAWFYGRLNMSETLRAVGAPLPEVVDTVSGGIGGGDRVIPEDALDPAKDLDRLLGDIRQVLLLNAAVVVLITFGLAGIALLVRRRTR